MTAVISSLPTSGALIFGPAIGRLEHLDARELRQRLLHPRENPYRDILRRRIAETVDLVQAMMIERLKQRPERLLDVEEIDDEAGFASTGPSTFSSTR